MFVDEGLGDPVAHGITFSGCLLTPRSRGDVSLRSNDPTAKPWIRHNFYSEPADFEVMLAGLRKTLEIARQPALSRYCAEGYLTPTSESDDDLRAHAARNSQTLYHPVGTCAMGTGEDAVVDAELRVRGIDGLRVVDASVMPTIVRGNTNAPTIAIAERAADLVLDRPAVSERASAAA
jgi:choline dehydrogenase